MDNSLRDSRPQLNRKEPNTDMTRMVKAVVDSVRRKIAIGLYRPGAYVPSENELAKELQVSRGTVRKALDILTDAGDIDRRPHSRPTIPFAASRTVRPKPAGKEVHVWVNHPIGDEPSLFFLKGLSRGFSGSAYRIVVREPSRTAQEVIEREETAFFKEVINNPEAVGAVVMREPYAQNVDLIVQMQNMGKHIVFVDSAPPEGVTADHVGTANLYAARTAVEYLIGQGHQRIAFLVDTLVPSANRERAAGYRRAMAQAGLEEYENVICAAELPPSAEANNSLAGRFTSLLKQGSYYSDIAWRLAKEVLVANETPTAIFVAYDILAYWVAAYLEGSGLRIPDNIAIVGFDNLGRWESYSENLLTTASQDFMGFGHHAANLIIDRIEGIGGSNCRSIQIDAPLVVRASTLQDGPIPAHKGHRATDEGLTTADRLYRQP